MTAMDSDLRSLQFASYAFHILIRDIFSTIEAGGCLCIPSKQEDTGSAEVMEFIARNRTNWGDITPCLTSFLGPAKVPTLPAICLMGKPLARSQAEAWSSRLQLINIYGPRECTIACLANSRVKAK
ncbi:hypothetical protein MCOR25_010519 [Pyricularia grisea]|nr:hypothetical protein MCOR25_010519 [Pyricularia grisea]